MKRVGLYFVVNEAHSKEGIITDVNNAIQSGVKVVHYSEKKLRKRQVLENAYILSALCKKNNVLFIIEDYPDIATLVGADGVHLTQGNFSIEHVRKMIGDEKYIGVHFTSLREAVLAEDHGANYISIGSRVGEQQTTKATIVTLKKMKELLTVPIIAMGTFTVDQAQDLFRAGVDGVALLPALYYDSDLHANMRQVLQAVRQ